MDWKFLKIVIIILSLVFNFKIIFKRFIDFFFNFRFLIIYRIIKVFLGKDY